jgi:hypothetical protein
MTQSVPYAQPQVAVPLTDQTQQDSTLVVVAWVVAALTGLYMLPWAVAVTRCKANHVAVAMVNIFLGWTVIGWIVALVMACSAHRVVGWTSVAPVQSAPAGWYPAPNGSGQEYWDGQRWTGHRAP